VPIVLKSGILNLLEPYGPVQACTSNALPLPLVDVEALGSNPVPHSNVSALFSNPDYITRELREGSCPLSVGPHLRTEHIAGLLIQSPFKLLKPTGHVMHQQV
jgi:hypothetical protein